MRVLHSGVEINGARRRIFRIVLAPYGLLMLWLLFGQRIGRAPLQWSPEALAANVNLIPLHTVLDYIEMLLHSPNPALVRHAVVNLLGNVIMFVPLGLLVPIVGRRLSFLRTMLISLCAIAAVELLQLLTLLGSMDVDDLLLNLLGAAVGYLLHPLLLCGASPHRQ